MDVSNLAIFQQTRPKVYRCDICTTARLTITIDSVCLMHSLYYILTYRQLLTCQLPEWLADWLTDELAERQNNWLTD